MNSAKIFVLKIFANYLIKETADLIFFFNQNMRNWYLDNYTHGSVQVRCVVAQLQPYALKC